MKVPTILLLTLAVPLAGLSVASAVASVTSAEDAIAAITATEKVTYSDASREAIDAAVAAVDALGPGFNLEERVSNLEDLTAAEVEYVRLAIKTADVADRRKVQEGTSDAEVAQLISDARTTLQTYFDEDDYALVPNYDDLLLLESNATYHALIVGGGDQTTTPVTTDASSAFASSDDSCEVELC